MNAKGIYIPENYMLLDLSRFYQAEERVKRIAAQLAYSYNTYLLSSEFVSVTDFFSAFSGGSFYGSGYKYRADVQSIAHFLEIPCSHAKIGRTMTQCFVILKTFQFRYNTVYAIGEHPVGCCPFKKGWKWRAKWYNRNRISK